MTDRIQEITEKIYNEGVVKAKEDADLIIAEARTKADEIVNSAKKMQTELLEEAQKQTTELKRKSEAELQLAARQFISKLKQQITNLVTTSQVNDSVKNVFNDQNFVQEIIQTIIKNWNPQSSDQLDLKVLLPEKKEKELAEFFNLKTRETLGRGVEFKFDSTLETGFKIGPKDGSYILNFSDKDFENYFKSYFKDQTKRLLFDSVDKE